MFLTGYNQERFRNHMIEHSPSSPPICVTWRCCAGSSPVVERFPIQPPPVSLDEASLHLPSGAYTTFRTYHHDQAFHIDDHLNRLEESARLTGRQVALDRDQIRGAIRQAIRAFNAPETRVRVSLDLSKAFGQIYISLEKLKTPTDQQYSLGINVAMIKMARENPQAKLTGFIAQAAVIRRSLPEGATEGIMLDPSGDILEGLSSNFFGVIAGEIYTSNQAVLAGITRALVIEEASQAGYPVHLDCLPFSYSQRFSEAFITSSSRAVLPVVRINEWIVGTGLPGPITKGLLTRYRARIEREIKPI
jgi:branched-chain amino acid aminotransferase